MNLRRFVLIFVILTTAAYGQFSTTNPLDDVKNQIAKVLTDAKIPFTPDQDRQLALFMEEQRQASENLFGVIMDFSNGPPQGEQRDRALAGIQWMHDEFKKKLPTYLTDEQRAAWEEFESRGAAVEARIEGAGTGGARKSKIQQIRVTNNAFNVEDGTAGRAGPNGGGARTEVIERGGAGAYHGNFSSTFQSESLNARNPFASNKPPYYERTINGNISGPVIRNRLSMNFTVNDNKQENVGTVKAITPDGPFELGVTRPTLNRYYDVKTITQLADLHSLNVTYRYSTSDSRNQNVGNFTLPERAARTQGQNYMLDVREISILSERTVHDLQFTWRKDHSERTPASNAVAITVTDAFSGGGAQGKGWTNGNTYELSNLLYYAGEKHTMRSGFQSLYRREESTTEDNFGGEFTFPDLASYLAGTPQKFKITRGDPFLKMSQLQVSFFTQNDFKLTNTFSLMLGARYQVQTNIHDRNNIDPRAGFAYAIGNSTVVRGGVGVFHSWVSDNDVQTVLRLDGKRQYQIQVDNPGWPDPFVSGNVTTIPPSSRHVHAPGLQAQYYVSSQIVLERSLPNNLFVTVSYDHDRSVRTPRIRDLNAPLPDTGLKPFPNEGQIIQHQGTGLGTHQNFRASMRQRFSIFNVNANYSYYTGWNDDGASGGATGGGGSGSMPSNSYNLHADIGNPAFGPSHQLSSSVNSKLPLDVYLTTNITARSKSLYNITTGKDDNKDGVINDRPAGLPKNSGRGPRYFNVSFNFSKAFELKRAPQGSGGRGGNAAAGPQMNVFANLSNAFNMTHLGTPSGVMTSPFFMKSFNASSPREIEVGMRFQF